MESRGLLAGAPWPLNVPSQILRISLQISGLSYIRGGQSVEGSMVSQRKSSNGIQQQGMEVLDCS